VFKSMALVVVRCLPFAGIHSTTTR
jgi:hypothetical protein